MRERKRARAACSLKSEYLTALTALHVPSARLRLRPRGATCSLVAIPFCLLPSIHTNAYIAIYNKNKGKYSLVRKQKSTASALRKRSIFYYILEVFLSFGVVEAASSSLVTQTISP